MSDYGGAGVAMALAAGERVWIDGETAPSGIERMTAVVELAALASVASSLWLMRGGSWPPADFRSAAPHLGTVAAALFASRPINLLLRTSRAARLWPSVLWRSACGIALVAALVANAPDWGVVATCPLGIAFGADLALGAWRLGLGISLRRWWLGFATSPLHIGAIGAMFAAVLRLGWRDGLREAVAYFVILHLLVAITCGTAALLRTVRSQQLDADRLDHERIVADEHRRRAHWLHDDVSSQIRIVSLRIQNETLDRAGLVGLLDELDHQLRLRQLDELLEAGNPRLAEIIQPYVRNAQTHGVHISAVPTLDDASLVVSAGTGRLFARAASIFTTNAVQAGATRIGFEVEHDDATIRLTVSDNAGGFDLASAPAGRALWELGTELGPGAVTSRSVDDGSVMTVLIPHDGSQSNGHAAAR